MGNRAVITTRKDFDTHGVGVYLHWCGGRDMVEAFLKYMKLRGIRPPEYDCYGWARLCQVIGNYIGGDLSVGIDIIDRLDIDNFDNGTYIIENWEIVGREYFSGEEETGADLKNTLIEIDLCQPKPDQLGKRFWNKWKEQSDEDI